jgi:large subunit ribosomal protein L33
VDYIEESRSTGQPGFEILIEKTYFQAIHYILRRKQMAAGVRQKVILACTECKQRNYNTMKNKRNNPDRIELMKYCKFCNKETLHKETK